jgi:hypothetical protein
MLDIKNEDISLNFNYVPFSRYNDGLSRGSNNDSTAMSYGDR